MVNPFDKTFFRFVLGFVVILCFSLAVLIVTNWRAASISEKELTATKNIVEIEKAN